MSECVRSPNELRAARVNKSKHNAINATRLTFLTFVPLLIVPVVHVCGGWGVSSVLGFLLRGLFAVHLAFITGLHRLEKTEYIAKCL